MRGTGWGAGGNGVQGVWGSMQEAAGCVGQRAGARRLPELLGARAEAGRPSSTRRLPAGTQPSVPLLRSRTYLQEAGSGSSGVAGRGGGAAGWARVLPEALGPLLHHLQHVAAPHRQSGGARLLEVCGGRVFPGDLRGSG